MGRTDRDEGARARTHEIAAMFDRVAPRYDFLNHVLSLRMDARWRRRAVRLARLEADEVALDLGVGTGDHFHRILGGRTSTSLDKPIARLTLQVLTMTLLGRRMNWNMRHNPS